ncbi:MAG: non-hydrolyzing UDP-N-acetylglucosamine 2-epimerase [Salinivirgaceae bacterium]
MKIATIIGARPQFIKAAVISRNLKNHPDINEILIHTGQHYDRNMSEIFFQELEIPKPQYNLGVGSGNHGEQTGKMLQQIEAVLLNEKPNVVLVYGDTNSTLAGALAASKLNIPIAHVEAGLRSFNRKMPEEINRIATDHISDLLFAPTQNAMNLLAKEGLAEQSFLTGDIMYDSVLFYKEKALRQNYQYPFDDREFYLATIHRQENTDDPKRLQAIFTAFSNLDKPVLLPLHPRVRNFLKTIHYSENIKITEPVGYLNLLQLISKASKVLTDSGGLQKEAFFMKVPCITLRNETEWIETIEHGWNHVVGTDQQKIIETTKLDYPTIKGNPFGDGKAGEKILNHLQDFQNNR